MNENRFEIIDTLLAKYSSKFGHTWMFARNLMNVVDEAVLGIENEKVFELMELLQKSLNDNVDYLPQKYDFDPKDFEGDINADVIN